jgi:methylglutaconyl-CoA hydratase
MRQMSELSAQRFTSAEGQEGIASFMEKRPASWIPEPEGD